MSLFVFSLLLAGLSLCAGTIGALTGLGGGVVIIPVLSLPYFGIPLNQVMGLALIISMTNSLIASRTFSKANLTHLRLGLLLETGTAFGAILGALIVVYLPSRILIFMLSLTLMFSCYSSWRRQVPHSGSDVSMNVEQIPGPRRRLVLSYLIMLFAGIMSGLLGIGSGVFKVLAMDNVLGLPYKIATATSNYMVGITAATSLGVYISHQYINLHLLLPVLLGTGIGSHLGSKLLLRVDVSRLRKFFNALILIMSIQMLHQAIKG